MQIMKVTVPLLNKRAHPVENTSDVRGILGRVKRDFEFESIGQETNASGIWYKDRDGHWYWGGGLVALTHSKENTLSTREILNNEVLNALQIPNIWLENERGDKAVVAIIDSGIALNCPDLTQAVAQNVPGGFSNAGFRMKNFVAGSITMDDALGHGSHCAGLIASRNNDNIVGVAPACELYVGKISDEANNPTVPNMIDAIKWASGITEGSPQNIDIISMSVGSLLNIPDMQPTIDDALRKNKILVFSIGNKKSSGSSQIGGDYPAACNNVISVGAVDLNNEYQSFSYFGSNLTIACPGVDITSYHKHGKIFIDYGSSQSTAICAGVIALLVSKLKKEGFSGIPNKIMSLLESSPRNNTNGFDFRFIKPYELFKSI